MIDLSGNIKLSFGAKYVAEDTASYILYKFDRASLDGRAVCVERLARFLGMDVACEYITGDCEEMLGVATYEPQRLYCARRALDLERPAAVVERDIIDRGESGLYRLTVALCCAHYLFHAVKCGEQESGQLSFGLESVESENRKEIYFSDFCESVDTGGGGAENFALKLLMPKNGFKRQAVEIYSSLGVNRSTLDAEKHLPAVLDSLSERYGVPQAAVLVRLRQLNLY